MPCGPQCRCCILALCCPPGGSEQRSALHGWLVENFRPLEGHAGSIDVYIDGKLEELFRKEEKEGTVIASAEGPFTLGDEPLEIDLDLNQDDGG